MKSADEKYYNELFDMFNSAGWRHYREHIQGILSKAESAGWDIRSGDGLVFNAGVIQNLKELKNFQEVHEQQYTVMQEEE